MRADVFFITFCARGAVECVKEVFSMNRWCRHFYQPGIPLGKDGCRVTCSEEHIALSRRAAAEGAVLLKNEGGILPLRNSRLAVFGKGIADYVKGGGGSGDVTVPYIHNILDGLEEKRQRGLIDYDQALAGYYRNYVEHEYAEGLEPGLIKEAEFPSELAENARRECDAALIAISRFSGENWDRISEGSPVFSTEKGTMELLEKEAAIFEHGDFYLSDAEKKMVSSVLSLFDNVIVVLNAGGMVDVSWIAGEPKIRAALQAFQGGMEGGAAIADILTGEKNPSGRLTDTYARDLSDYPSSHNFHESLDYVEYQDDIFVGYRYFSTIPGAEKKVVYPFGYGLSYTSFRLEEFASSFVDGEVRLTIRVSNTGKYAGRDVVEIYMGLPEGKLDKPSRMLAAFAKTEELSPGCHEDIAISFPLSAVSEFDDEGAVSEGSWLLEKGSYRILVTDDSISFMEASADVVLENDLIISSPGHHLVPNALTKRLRSSGEYEELKTSEKTVPMPVFPRQDASTLEGVEPLARARNKRLTREDKKNLAKGFFSHVADGDMTLDDFISSLPVDVLVDITGGQPNTGVADTYGIGNQEEFGIPNVMTADGPAGLRIRPGRGVTATAWPCATLLASTWDTELVEAVGKAGGAEVKENNIGIWLTPAVNIHRSPLCGRNFEYYSEDPLIAGKIGAAMVRGIQSNGVGACVKHFALNNKETNRKDSDSRASERAIREIYLRQFEIVIKESDPVSVMSSYNIINGVKASENRELLTDILRGEWGFSGFVTTDWWTHGEHYLELLAGNDLKMGNGYPERVHQALEAGAITADDIRKNVRCILSGLLRLE